MSAEKKTRVEVPENPQESLGGRIERPRARGLRRNGSCQRIVPEADKGCLMNLIGTSASAGREGTIPHTTTLVMRENWIEGAEVADSLHKEKARQAPNIPLTAEDIADDL